MSERLVAVMLAAAVVGLVQILWTGMLFSRDVPAQPDRPDSTLEAPKE